MPKALWMSCEYIVDELFNNCLKTGVLPHHKILSIFGCLNKPGLSKVCSQNLPKKSTPFLYFFNLLRPINPHNPQGLLKQLLFYINNTNINKHLMEA